jgi:hypothetical protein
MPRPSLLGIGRRHCIDSYQCLRKRFTLKAPKHCRHCNALLLNKERPGLCCLDGKVQLPPLSIIPENLATLYHENSPLGRHFRSNIRKYNQAFAFTSLGAQVDQGLANQVGGVYTFRISGQLYHQTGPLLPVDGQEPKFSQIFFMDQDQQVNRRANIFQDLDMSTLQSIQSMLYNGNPFVDAFKQAKGMLRTSTHFKISWHPISVSKFQQTRL